MTALESFTVLWHPRNYQGDHVTYFCKGSQCVQSSVLAKVIYAVFCV